MLQRIRQSESLNLAASGSTQPPEGDKHIQPLFPEVPSVLFVLPALPTERVAAHIGRDDASVRAVADLAAHQRVAAKRLRLALCAFWEDGPRWADTVTRHRLAQPRTTVTGCR